MVIQRGEIWWATLPEPVGSEPGYRRPVLIVQSDDFNRSRIATVIGVVITSLLLAVILDVMFQSNISWALVGKSRSKTGIK